MVGTPEPGHEQYVGRLCIPYANRLGVIGVKFRCLAHDDCKIHNCDKYLGPAGQDVYLYNVLAVEADADTIHLCEGEIDTLVLSSVLGEPVVGIPGASNWQGHYPYHFKSFERVLIWADGDKAGGIMADKVRKELLNAESVPMPRGHDVNSLYAERGADGVRSLVGNNDDD